MDSEDETEHDPYGPNPPKVITVLTGGKIHNDATVVVHYNGRRFNINMSPDFFDDCDDPALKSYLHWLEVLHPDGPGESGYTTAEDVYDRIIELFWEDLKQVAPEPLPQFDPTAIGAGIVIPLLSDYLFPETHNFQMGALEGMFNPLGCPGLSECCPCRQNSSRLVGKRESMDEEMFDEMESWTRFYEPSKVEVCFEDPDDALDSMPTRVRVVPAEGGEPIMCYFKEFEPLQDSEELLRELHVFKNIFCFGLGDDVQVGRLVGVIRQAGENTVLGLLLRYIDNEQTLRQAVRRNNPSRELREKWAAQVTRAVHELHRIECVWGDAKSSNVLIDREENAWVVNFEGGYTPGWVEEDEADTVEGDLHGLERIVRFIHGES